MSLKSLRPSYTQPSSMPSSHAPVELYSVELQYQPLMVVPPALAIAVLMVDMLVYMVFSSFKLGKNQDFAAKPPFKCYIVFFIISEQRLKDN